jgi:hypothetical protein
MHMCPPDICTTPDGKVWWGWSNAVIAWKVRGRGGRPAIGTRLSRTELGVALGVGEALLTAPRTPGTPPQNIKPGLQPIRDRGVLYTLAPDPRAANQSFLARSSKVGSAQGGPLRPPALGRGRVLRSDSIEWACD